MGELKQLGRYEIVRVLGSGAMGIVYEGLDTSLNRRVAIKTIIRSALADSEQAADYSQRFMREAQAVARLNHSNIVTVYDFGEEGDIAYFVMEFIQGNELKQFLDSGVRFSLPKSLGLMTKLLDALEYAHSQGIVHRDIKPANIMIDKTGRLKLTDFGVVKFLDNVEGTQAGTMVGTPGYMSPEQILGTSVSPKSDIFAAGVVLYQLLTGQKPFTGDGVFAIQQKIVNEDPPAPSSIDPTLPPIFDQIISKALAKKPEQRYANANEFAEDIRRAMPMEASQQAAGEASALAGAAQADEKTIVTATGARPAVEKTVVTAKGAPQAYEKTVVTPTAKSGAAEAGAEDVTLDRFLEERAKLDAMFAEKFTRFITVMFTDLKGSTTIAETEGDLVSRMIVKQQSDIIMPAVSDNNGVFVKSIGDGTLSYFDNALDAVRAAVQIQKGMDALNMSKTYKFPVLMRIGMHSGKCVVEEHDIAGDVVNTASRFESAADGGGILMSEDTYNALSDKSEIYCRFVKQVTLKGKKEPFNAYKAFWNPQEIELDKKGKTEGAAEAAAPAKSSGGRLIWIIAAVAIILLLAIATSFFGTSAPKESRHSISDSAAPAEKSDIQR
jgi:class 3 adenylate cyclase/tRNA A-37 threonylcarbamoyl transferase component Bud32